MSYLEQAIEAAKPLKQRSKTVTRKDGSMTRARRHHISPEVQSRLRAEARDTGRFVSPHRVGSYWGISETLSVLGENQVHEFPAFWSKYVDVMSDEKHRNSKGKTPWEIWSNKPRRSFTTGKAILGKIHQNIRVLQRLCGENPYGLKLAQLNACIDVFGENVDHCSLRLRTGIPEGEIVVPIREIRQRSVSLSYQVRAGFSVDMAGGRVGAA